ncbi:MAG: hypothetical protein O2954_03455, partial [bacterium]|nr:hypothetical protein [bacterium]
TVNLAVINAPVAEALAAGEPVASLPPWWTGLYTKAALLAYGKMLVGIGGIACIISALASEKLMFGYELGCAAALSNGKDAPPDAAGHTQLFYAKKNLVIQNNDWHIHFTGPVNSDWLPGK